MTRKSKLTPHGKDGKDPSEKLLASVGGKKLRLGGGGAETWFFGWIPPENRTVPQQATAELAVKAMPRFLIADGKGGDGASVMDGEKFALYETWKHTDVVKANDLTFTGIHQKTGSCVGAGGGNCWFTLACVDAVIRGEFENPLVPFWLLPYGRSRYYLGDRSPGEGSTGSTFAKAAREDGTIPATSPGLPKWSMSDGMLTWGSQAEMKWSDGDNPDTMALLPQSRVHLVKTTAQCRTHNDVYEAIKNGYPCTVASMYAHDGGRVQGEGSDAVLLGRRQGSWSHQMSIIAVWRHPKFGLLFYLMNQWGQSAHGRCPSGAPWGGVWITGSDVDWICRDEAYAFSQWAGFIRQDPMVWIAA